MQQSWRDHARLIGALAAKDIVDALKTKTTLATIIISLLMVLFYRYFPLLTADDTLNVLVHAQSESALMTALERSPGMALYTSDSRERLLDVFRDVESVELALEIPATAVDLQQSDAPITIDGRVMYWVSAAQRAEIKALVEEELTTQLVAWFVIIPLLIPVILVALEGLVPSGAVAVMNWLPTVLADAERDADQLWGGNGRCRRRDPGAGRLGCAPTDSKIVNGDR